MTCRVQNQPADLFVDANLFRRFCASFATDLPGTRLGKIHQPGPGVTIFSLYGYWHGVAAKRHLVLKAERKAPLIFFSDYRLPVNAPPPAQVMRLRKHLSDRHLAGCAVHWSERRLYLQIASPSPLWLELDLREGPQILFADPPPYLEPDWPDISQLRNLEDLEAYTTRWRTTPTLTPALRRTLPYLDLPEAKALLQDLQYGEGDVFLYENAKGQREISAWPLPLAQLKSMPGFDNCTETILDDPQNALALAGEAQVFEPLARQTRQMAAKPFSAEVSRLARLQTTLERDEERLQAMCAKQTEALLLKSQLYQLDKENKAASVIVNSENGPEIQPVEILLNPRLTVRENMDAMFHTVGRGKRGLEHLKLRRQAVADQKEAAMQAMLSTSAAVNGAVINGGFTENRGKTLDRPAEGNTGKPHSKSPDKFGKKTLGTTGSLPKQVQAFRSSDGFLLLCGRDIKGNGLALKMASPHDYWLHTANGPSAHLIIRRDHPGQTVPERTLQEAGTLVAQKSWLKDAEQAEIQYALAKHIHPLKNAPPGTVRIDKSEGSFGVNLGAGPESDQKSGLKSDLEEKLKII